MNWRRPRSWRRSRDLSDMKWKKDTSGRDGWEILGIFDAEKRWVFEEAEGGAVCVRE